MFAAIAVSSYLFTWAILHYAYRVADTGRPIRFWTSLALGIISAITGLVTLIIAMSQLA
jgi:hypothetical protein